MAERDAQATPICFSLRFTLNDSTQILATQAFPFLLNFIYSVFLFGYTPTIVSLLVRVLTWTLFV